MRLSRRLCLLTVISAIIIALTLYRPDADGFLHRLEGTAKDFFWFAAAMITVVKFLLADWK